jgi:hypothetical protein
MRKGNPVTVPSVRILTVVLANLVVSKVGVSKVPVQGPVAGPQAMFGMSGLSIT